MLFDYINDKTGFANGDLFDNEQQVRDYFTMNNMIAMFGVKVENIDGDELSIMADVVISNKWHINKSKTKVFSIRVNTEDSEEQINQKLSELQEKVRRYKNSK